MHDIDEGGHVFISENISKDNTRNIHNSNSSDTIPTHHISQFHSNKENIQNYFNIKESIDKPVIQKIQANQL